MPPIMGAGAFIMSEITGIPYAQIMLISIFPALMYFFSVYIMIHYEAKIHNIKGIKSTTSAIHILRKRRLFRNSSIRYNYRNAIRLFTRNGRRHRIDILYSNKLTT